MAMVTVGSTRDVVRLRMFWRMFVVWGLVAAVTVLIPLGMSRADAAGGTFNVTRNGTTSTYVASSGAQTFTGSLKSVVESASAVLHADGGGTVKFSAGDFNLANEWFEIEDWRNIVYDGAGIDQTTIRNVVSVDKDTEVFDLSRSDRITISDMTISAGGSPRTTSDAIDFDGGDDSIVERVKITSSRGRGIIFDGKDDVPTSGGTADRNIVRDCIITGVPGVGIEFLASNNNTVDNCTISNIGGHGINMTKGSTSADQANKPSNDNRITNNTITNVGQHGLRINSGNRNVLSQNTVFNSSDDFASRDGINLVSSNGIACNDNVIEYNTASDNQTPKTQRWGLNISSAECNRTVVRANNLVGNLTGEIRDVGTNTIYGSSSDTQAPSKPGTPVASNVTSSSVTLNWAASTDNVAVIAYDVRRGSNVVGSVGGSTTTYVDNTVTAATTYQYTIVARDLAGNLSSPSNPVSVTVGGSSGTLNFEITQDSYVSASAPTSNYGSATTLRADGSPAQRAYIRATVSGLVNPVQSAVLRLYANSAHTSGFVVQKVTNNTWSEATLNYNNAPSFGPPITTSGPMTAGSYLDIPVTSAIQANGTYNFAVTPLTNTALNLASSESANPPRLIVTQSAGGPKPSIKPGAAAVVEGDSGSVKVQVPVRLSSASATPVTVDWTTYDNANPGIATQGIDFLADSGTVTFAPGQTIRYVEVTVLGDLIDEPPAYLGEWAVLVFSNPSANATLDTSFFGLGIVIIVDDD